MAKSKRTKLQDGVVPSKSPVKPARIEKGYVPPKKNPPTPPKTDTEKDS